MGTKTSIVLLIAALLLVLVVGGAYAYDSSQKDKIAEGVTIGGVDVGGLDEDEATARVHRKLVAPLRSSLTVNFDGETWKLTGEKLKIRADIEGAVAEAVEDSQEGGLPVRLVRYVSGGEVDEKIAPEVAYSVPAVNRFVRRVAGDIDQEPQNADVEPSGAELIVVAGQPGRKLRDNLLEKNLKAAVLNANAPHAIRARVRSIAPEVTKQEVAAEYPSYLTLDRSSFTLRLWKNLKLAKTYTVAVGAEGFDTPEGLYQIEAMEENPVWNVPESDWAGSLAGQTIPPGPSNPIKARWMAIYEGAGIHGTEETSSLGTAASHGCVRMAIPDVEELYSEVELGTPIFLG
ncbi:MAG TPA: L,D-transpeptidase/peptidoglycan binding protein [Solirubrobacterales bacterium]